MRIGIVIFACLMVMIGCATPRAGEPVVQSVKADGIRGRLAFQRQITERKICSNDDAFHLLIQYTNREDPCADYSARLQWLRERLATLGA